VLEHQTMGEYTVQLMLDSRIFHELNFNPIFGNDTTLVTFPTSSLFKDDSFITRVCKTERCHIRVKILNNSKHIKFDTLISFNFATPPVVKNISIRNPATLKSDINLFNDKNDFVRKLLKSNKIGIYHDTPVYEKIFLDTPSAIFVKVMVDSAYEKSIIARWPNPKNKDYEHLPKIDDLLSNPYILLKIKSRPSEMFIEKEKYLIADTVSIPYTGETDIFLVNYSNSSIFYTKLFSVIVDNKKPVFTNAVNGFFTGDERYEGQVFLTMKDFYGYSPYRIPFEGTIYGDIKKLFVNGDEVRFTRGDLYFKKSIHLDGGYNRIPIKIIDKNGNTEHFFIPVTIERMDEDNIVIENNIDIENTIDND
jgi:hypothetical protein